MAKFLVPLIIVLCGVTFINGKCFTFLTNLFAHFKFWTDYTRNEIAVYVRLFFLRLRRTEFEIRRNFARVFFLFTFSPDDSDWIWSSLHKLMSMVKDAMITSVTSKYRIIIMNSVAVQFTMRPIVVQLGEFQLAVCDWIKFVNDEASTVALHSSQLIPIMRLLLFAWFLRMSLLILASNRFV